MTFHAAFRVRQLAFLAGLAVLAVLGTGCPAASSHLTHLHSSADFEKSIHQGKPAVVLFWKGGCALCGMITPTMDTLEEEYRGRVAFGDYQLMNLVFMVTDWPLRDKYDIGPYPTVVLFTADGREKRRWISHFNIKDYRKALTDLVGPPTSQPAEPAKVAPTKEAPKKEPPKKEPPKKDAAPKSKPTSVPSAGKVSARFDGPLLDGDAVN